MKDKAGSKEDLATWIEEGLRTPAVVEDMLACVIEGYQGQTDWFASIAGLALIGRFGLEKARALLATFASSDPYPEVAAALRISRELLEELERIHRFQLEGGSATELVLRLKQGDPI